MVIVLLRQDFLVALAHRRLWRILQYNFFCISLNFSERCFFRIIKTEKKTFMVTVATVDNITTTTFKSVCTAYVDIELMNDYELKIACSHHPSAIILLLLACWLHVIHSTTVIFLLLKKSRRNVGTLPTVDKALFVCCLFQARLGM